MQAIKKTLVFIVALFSATAVFAGDVYHRGYTRKNGTYVQPHYQTSPDSSRTNNYSSKNNYNPHTGKEGSVDPYKQPSHSRTNNDYQYNSKQSGSKYNW